MSPNIPPANRAPTLPSCAHLQRTQAAGYGDGQSEQLELYLENSPCMDSHRGGEEGCGDRAGLEGCSGGPGKRQWQGPRGGDPFKRDVLVDHISESYQLKDKIKTTLKWKAPSSFILP